MNLDRIWKESGKNLGRIWEESGKNPQFGRLPSSQRGIFSALPCGIDGKFRPQSKMWKKNFVEDTDIPVMPLDFFSIMMFISADWAVLEFRESLTFGSGLIRPPGRPALALGLNLPPPPPPPPPAYFVLYRNCRKGTLLKKLSATLGSFR